MRQRSLEAIRQKDERLHASARALNYLITADSQEVNLREAFRIIGRSMGVEHLVLYRSMESGGKGGTAEATFALSALFGWDHESGWIEATAGLDLNLDNYPGWKETILENEAVRVRSAEVVELSERELFRSLGVEAVLMVPIFLKGRWWGVFWADTESEDREWTAADVSIMGILGSSFAGMLERNQLESDLVAAKDSAEKLAEEARIATEAKSEFVANISHEIRTPMNAILGFAELLEKNIDDIKQREFVDAIMASGKTLLGLINDLLDLSKIEAGKMNIFPEPIDLGGVLEEVCRIFSLKAGQRGLDLSLTVSPGVPGCLMMDGTRLRQIAFNLIGNAVKFTDRGFVRVAVEARSAAEQRVDVWIRIEDSGRGISAEDQQAVFQPFEQVRHRSGEDTEGTGLGLAITRRLVDLMGGGLRLESKEGEGSCFEVFLPGVLLAGNETASLPEEGTNGLLEPTGSNEPEPASIPLDRSRGMELLDLAEGRLLAQWQRVGNVRQVSQIISFAEAVQEAGKAYLAEEWSRYGTGLKTAALSFDVSKIRHELERFPDIVQALRDLLAD